jgi:hypothetical protein
MSDAVRYLALWAVVFAASLVSTALTIVLGSAIRSRPWLVLAAAVTALAVIVVEIADDTRPQKPPYGPLE